MAVYFDTFTRMHKSFRFIKCLVVNFFVAKFYSNVKNKQFAVCIIPAFLCAEYSLTNIRQLSQFGPEQNSSAVVRSAVLRLAFVRRLTNERVDWVSKIDSPQNGTTKLTIFHGKMLMVKISILFHFWCLILKIRHVSGSFWLPWGCVKNKRETCRFF